MYDSIIEFGIIVLLIVTPLALGSVTEQAILFFESISSMLVIVLLVKYIFNRTNYHVFRAQKKSYRRRHYRYKRSSWVGLSPLFFLIMSIFLGLIIFQLIPLPTILVRMLSPAMYQLYADAASILTMSVPTWLSLTVCPHSTTMELLKTLSYIMVFFLVINTIHRTQQVKRLLYVILGIGFFEAFYGLLQFVSGQSRIYSYEITSPWVRGTFVNKNHFAGYMELIIPLAFGILLTRFEKRRTMSYASEEKYMKGIFVVFAVFVMLCGLFLSGSRGGVISFLCGTGCFILLTANRRLLHGWVMILLLVLSLALGIFIAVNPEFIGERLGSLAQLEADRSFRVRWELWKSAFHIFQDYPLFGSGLGTFTNLFKKYKTFRWNLDFNYPENDYIQLLSETGILGMGLMLVIAGIFLFHTVVAWKRQRSQQWVAIGAGGLSAMMSLAVHSVGDFNLHIPSNALLFSVVAALTYTSARMHQTEHSSQTNTIRKTNHTQELRYTKKGRRSSFLAFIIGVSAILLLLGSVSGYYAFVHYQQATSLFPSEQDATPTRTDHERILRHAHTAIRFDSQNAAYAFMLGSYLYHPSVRTDDAGGFAEAEHWLRTAIMLDPANPWYYYEMGLLGYARKDCHNWNRLHPDEAWDACPISRYFLTALANAPKNTFLRQAVGRWYAFDDRRTTVTLIRQLLADDNPDAPIDRSIPSKFSQFLYELGMDYESDQEALRALRNSSEESLLPACHLTILSQDQDAHRIELGNDDGSAEWSTHLNAETRRVKKQICLPDTLESYNTAMLRIFMNHSGKPNFTMQVSLDDQSITELPPIPETAQWYEIPLDTSLLAGKSFVTVYIRTSGTSEAGNSLQIWGDQDTPTTQSVFNLKTTHDLSQDEGKQIGEYIIRLVLNRENS